MLEVTACVRVKYAEQLDEIKISADDTIEDLKLRFYNMYKVKPSNQLIEGFKFDPKNDQDNIFNLLSEEILVLHNIDSKRDDKKPTKEKADSRTDFINATEKFIKKFETLYGKNHVDFFTGTIDEALSVSCFADISSRKVLLIYLHRDSDPLAQVFCPLLIQSQIKLAMNEKFILLGLDVESHFGKCALNRLICTHRESDVLEQCILRKEALLFFVALLDDKPEIFCYLLEASENIISNVLTTSGMFAKVPNFDNDGSDTELAAILSFADYFEALYGHEHVPFEESSLETALKKSCFAEGTTKKILALYFHNKETPFSKAFCPKLQNGCIRRLLSDNCIFLPWDISHIESHEKLTAALNAYEELSTLTIAAEQKISGLFLFLSIDTMILLHTMLGGKMSEAKMLTQIEEAIRTQHAAAEALENLNDLNGQFEEDGQFTSLRFQQMMFDFLGDRDYDEFEIGEHELLKNKIGFAFFGAPDSVDGRYRDATKNTTVDRAYKKICEVNDRYTEYPGKIIISVVYNALEPLPHEKIARATQYSDYNPLTDIMPQPIFVLKKCTDSDKPCRIFIDHNLRVYKSWHNYIQDNHLHPCIMVLPKDGRYQGDENGRVQLERHLSPKCGVSQTIVKYLDMGSMTVGLASGVVFGVSLIPAVTVAPIVLSIAGIAGTVVGAYGVWRSIGSLFDRRNHEMDMSFANSEARGAYINIIAGAMGFVGAGATTMVSRLVSQGANIPEMASSAVTVLNMANVATSGVGIANSSYEIYNQWVNENRTPSLLSVVQLSSSIIFFGHAVWNFTPTQVLIEETQAGEMAKYQQSLRSNRHRKTFRKLEQESIRQKNHDVVAGRSEVIATMRKVGGNRDEVFAILTRSNKNFNKNKVRFAASNGEIALNGVPMDVNNFGSLSKMQQSQYLIDLPPIPAPDAANVKASSSLINSMLTVDTFWQLGTIVASGGLARLISHYEIQIQEKLLQILQSVLDFVACDDCLSEFVKILRTDKVLTIFNVTMEYLWSMMDDYEREFQEREQEEQSSENSSRQHLDTAEWVLDLFEKVVRSFFKGGRIIEERLRELISYLTERLVEFVYRHQEEIERSRASRRRPWEIRYVICNTCHGKHLSD